jgi:hypothetical protein
VLTVLCCFVPTWQFASFAALSALPAAALACSCSDVQLHQLGKQQLLEKAMR